MMYWRIEVYFQKRRIKLITKRLRKINRELIANHVSRADRHRLIFGMAKDAFSGKD